MKIILACSNLEHNLSSPNRLALFVLQGFVFPNKIIKMEESNDKKNMSNQQRKNRNKENYSGENRLSH